jgi:hypothetical protein
MRLVLPQRGRPVSKDSKRKVSLAEAERDTALADLRKAHAEIARLKAEIPAAVERERLRMLAAWDAERDLRSVPG